jgi:Tfp pilus assembly protein PilF
MRLQRADFCVIALLVLAVAAAYWPALNGALLSWDDNVNITENELIRGLDAGRVGRMFTDLEQAMRYKPFSWLVWAVIYQSVGPAPWAYHAANLLLHAANTVLVFGLIRWFLLWRFASLPDGPSGAAQPEAPSSAPTGQGATTGTANRRALTVGCAAWGALAWALHPLRVEPVAWATGLPYGLSLAFALGSVLVYLRGRGHRSTKSTGLVIDYWMAIALYAASILSYPMTLTLPLALLVLEGFMFRRHEPALGGTGALASQLRIPVSSPARDDAPAFGSGVRFPARAERIPGQSSIAEGVRVDSGGPWVLHWDVRSVASAVLRLAPYWAVALVFAAVALMGRLNPSGVWEKPVSLEEFGLLPRLVQAFYIWAYYAWKPWLPMGLAPIYTQLDVFRPGDPLFVVSTLGVVGATTMLWCWRRRWPGLLVAWLVHLALLIPVLGLTEHPHFPSDRYGLVAAVAMATWLAAGLFAAVSRTGYRFAGVAVAALVLVLLGGMTRSQIRVWRSDLTLFTHLVQVTEGTAFGDTMRYRLALTHLRLRDFRAAWRELEGLAERHPRNVNVLHDAGFACHGLGRHQDAAGYYARALAQQPGDVSLRLNFGAALTELGQWREAGDQFETVLAAEPASALAHRNYAFVLRHLGQTNLAAHHLEQAARLESPASEARRSLPKP